MDKRLTTNLVDFSNEITAYRNNAEIRKGFKIIYGTYAIWANTYESAEMQVGPDDIEGIHYVDVVLYDIEVDVMHSNEEITSTEGAVPEVNGASENDSQLTEMETSSKLTTPTYLSIEKLSERERATAEIVEAKVKSIANHRIEFMWGDVNTWVVDEDVKALGYHKIYRNGQSVLLQRITLPDGTVTMIDVVEIGQQRYGYFNIRTGLVTVGLGVRLPLVSDNEPTISIKLNGCISGTNSDMYFVVEGFQIQSIKTRSVLEAEDTVRLQVYNPRKIKHVQRNQLQKIPPIIVFRIIMALNKFGVATTAQLQRGMKLWFRTHYEESFILYAITELRRLGLINICSIPKLGEVMHQLGNVGALSTYAHDNYPNTIYPRIICCSTVAGQILVRAIVNQANGKSESNPVLNENSTKLLKEMYDVLTPRDIENVVWAGFNFFTYLKMLPETTILDVLIANQVAIFGELERVTVRNITLADYTWICSSYGFLEGDKYWLLSINNRGSLDSNNVKRLLSLRGNILWIVAQKIEAEARALKRPNDVFIAW